MKKKLMREWEEATQKLTDYFVSTHFGKKGDCDVYWIADDVGGCVHVNDYFFSLQDIVDFLKYGYSTDQVFEYYAYDLNCAQDGEENPICIRDWKKLMKSK